MSGTKQRAPRWGPRPSRTARPRDAGQKPSAWARLSPADLTGHPEPAGSQRLFPGDILGLLCPPLDVPIAAANFC